MCLYVSVLNSVQSECIFKKFTMANLSNLAQICLNRVIFLTIKIVKLYQFEKQLDALCYFKLA